MNILVANDDGIGAEGIRVLADRLKKAGNRIFVSAPASQMSGAAHSITTKKKIKVKPVEYDGAAGAICVGGTPSDCVRLGIYYFGTKGIDMDMVFSGINHGSNLGTDTLYSGTVAAAVEGALCGKRSAAVSIDSSDPVNFDTAADLAVKVQKKIEGMEDVPAVININTPDLPKSELAGIRVTRLGRRGYEEGLSPEDTKDGEFEYSYGGKPLVYESSNDDIDVIADQDRFATLTPLGFDLTDHEKIDALKKWEITL